MDELKMKLGIKLGYVITGLLGGLMSLMFNKRPKTRMEKIKSYTIVVLGALLTGYITPLILLKWSAFQNVEYSIAFIVGLFGMGITEAIFVLIQKLKENPIETIKSIKSIFTRNV